MKSNVISVNFVERRRLKNLKTQLSEIDRLISEQTLSNDVDRIRLEALCFHKATVQRLIRQIECPIIPSAFSF